MNTERWAQIEDVFSRVLGSDPEGRDRHLAEACAGDSELRKAVEELLAQHDSDPDFLETPIASVAGMGSGDNSPSDKWVGPYRLVKRLGQGGIGEVFLARVDKDGVDQFVALKIVKPGMGSDEVLERFRLERRILAGLQHPYIAHFLDAGVGNDGRPYFAMEYVEGVPLLQYCDDKRLGVRDRIGIFRLVCEAVQHAHHNLVLHRDLKPANILVDADGAPRLLDFGIAKLVTPEAVTDSPTRTGGRMLTPEYAAPEQLTGAPVSVSTDVYGLGVLLYELLTSKRPHVSSGGDWTALQQSILTSEPLKPSAAVGREEADTGSRIHTSQRRLSRTLAGDLDTIVLKALRKEPERRYTSVSALSEDLRRYLVGLPVMARPDTITYRAKKYLKRNAIPVSAAAAVALSLIGSTVFSLDQSRRVSAERDKALEVRSFLLEMFGSTGPDQATGDTVTARQLLDQQAATLDIAYAADPILHAEMSMVLAEGYDRMGLLAEAESFAEGALGTRIEVLGPDHQDVAASLALLGWIQHEAGRSDEGEARLREAIPTLRRGRDSTQGLARALNDFGVIRDAAGDQEEAEQLYVEALELRRAVHGDAHRAVAVTASNLSVILYRRGDYEGAVTAASEALAVMQRAVGADHKRSLIIQGNLAAMSAALGDNDAAVRVYRDLLVRSERLFGPEQANTIRVLGSLGTVLSNEGRWGEAEVVLRRSLDAQKRSLGATHPQVGLVQIRLAQVLNGAGRNAEALALSEPATEILIAGVGRNHPAVAEALETTADAVESSDPSRAEELHSEAIAILVERNGAEHPSTAQAQMRLADRLKKRDRHEEALVLYQQALVTFLASLPEGHPHIHRVRVRIAEANYRLERWATADSLLTAAEEGFTVSGASAGTRALADTLRLLVDQRGPPGN